MIPKTSTCCGPDNSLPVADVCPFHSDTDGHCRATLSGLSVDRLFRSLRCTTEDYDGCSLFLGRMLRSSRPKARLEPWPIHQK